MKKYLTLLFLLFSTCIFSQEYTSNYSETYIYDSISNEYVLKEPSCDSIKIEIDTLEHKIYVTQEIENLPLCLNSTFNIKDKDFNEEEQTHYYFVEELNRNYIIYLLPKDSLMSIVLENEYVICYLIHEKL